MKLRIAVVQAEIAQFSPEANLRKAERYVRKATAAKADLVVFPESFVTGPVSKEAGLIDSHDAYLRAFQAMAKAHRIDIVPGSMTERRGSELYNTTYYIDRSGRVLGEYRKVNLWDSERADLSPGHDVPVFKTRLGRVGLCICWDLAFQEVFREMVRQRVELVICPSCWCYIDAGIGIRYGTDSEIKFVDSLCVGRAFENEIVFVYCDAAGGGSPVVRKGVLVKDALIGHSQVTVPFKGRVAGLMHNREAMFIADVDTEILADAEKVYKIRSDLRKAES